MKQPDLHSIFDTISGSIRYDPRAKISARRISAIRSGLDALVTPLLFRVPYIELSALNRVLCITCSIFGLQFSTTEFGQVLAGSKSE